MLATLMAACGGETAPRATGPERIDWVSIGDEGPSTPARPTAIDLDWLDFGVTLVEAASGPTVTIDWGFVARAALARRYGEVSEAVYVVAIDRAGGRAYVGPIDPRSPDQPPFSTYFDQAIPADGLTSTAGSRRADLRAVLALPPEAVTYDVALFLETVVSPLREVSVPAARGGTARAAESTPAPSVPTLRVTESTVASPALHPLPGCASLRLELPGATSAWVAIAAPTRLEATAITVPAAPSPREVAVRGCDLMNEAPSAGRFHTFALAMVETNGERALVGPIALAPDITPEEAAPAPEILPSDADGDPGSPRCEEDEDCVLIAGVCGPPHAVPRATAAERAARNHQMASVAECARMPPVAPSEAVCGAGRCQARPLDEAPWRSCRRDRDCVPVELDCRGWTPVNRSSQAAAAERWRSPVVCPSILPEPPRLVCFAGFCAEADGVHVHRPAR
jgi:hypothetical protein